MTNLFEDFFTMVRQKERFVVVCHVHPDGDAIGSLLAVGLTLRKLGKSVNMICSDGIPPVYGFLEGTNLIGREIGNFDPEVIICVDCAEKERVAVADSLWESSAFVINIDHHVTNSGFGGLNIVDPEAAATGEIVFKILTAGPFQMDKAIASAVYTAIATDTGFFRYSSTSAFTLESASLLVKDYQVEPAKIAEQVHDQKSYNSVRLLGVVLNTLKVDCNGKVAWLILDQSMLSQFPVDNEETESFVNYARSLEGVEVGILFKELKPDEIKISWRSTSAVDVSKLAAFYGGGGHARAAGCTIMGPIQQVVNEVIAYVSHGYGAAHVARNNDY
ncbi:phosphoesterase RecJ-like protein [Hydrogenispora ethanolica]|uniref:Phosphoesterase RecJ-like protein n=1 Tax=Hydrogenispora ethanolica TaxID=1082276 RepID=A0A4V2QBC3_HYDET|nr:bifunctional oligoribonuclease/PAP phosphatase NrnA [Hydrogenispora ethanolica]TCL55862.1 phosphoesterase RecJ-like protein [Hydrogenispora ethanolica]